MAIDKIPYVKASSFVRKNIKDEKIKLQNKMNDNVITLRSQVDANETTLDQIAKFFINVENDKRPDHLKIFEIAQHMNSYVLLNKERIEGKNGDVIKNLSNKH